MPRNLPPNRIEKFRVASHLSRAGVADRLGVGEATIARWERGGAQVPDEKKLALAELFGGVSVAYLMGWENEPPKPSKQAA